MFNRMNIPVQNRKKFDIELEDHFRNAPHADPGYRQKLQIRWMHRVEFLKNEYNCCHAPPCLIRQPGEKLSDYMNRCYASVNMED